MAPITTVQSLDNRQQSLNYSTVTEAIGNNLTNLPMNLTLSDSVSPVCGNNTFGNNCARTCGHCKLQDCHPESGVCYEGCEPGYTGAQCMDGK